VLQITSFEYHQYGCAFIIGSVERPNTRLVQVVPVFTGGEQKIQDLNDDGGACNAYHHNPHDQKEERHWIRTEAPKFIPQLLNPLARHLPK